MGVFFVGLSLPPPAFLLGWEKVPKKAFEFLAVFAA